MASVFIDGQAGTTGLDIARRLAAAPDIALIELPPADRKSADARAEAMRQADVAILCLPDDAARESAALAARLGNAAPRLLDASTAHRTNPAWSYGFAELDPGQKGRIAAAALVANPGCYATGAIALLRPLIAAGLIAADAPISINAVSGYSGGGHAMIAAHKQQGGPAFELYALDLAHKHVPEIVAHAGLAETPLFVPSVAHLRQGMLVSIPVHGPAAPLFEALQTYYAGAEQVRVVTPAADGRSRADGLTGSDVMELTVHGNNRQAVLLARLDNLGKGASGAAMQNLRLMLGRG